MLTMDYIFEVGDLLCKIEKVISSTNDKGVKPKEVLEMYKSVLSKLPPPYDIRETGRHGQAVWKIDVHSYVSRVVCEEYGIDDLGEYIDMSFRDGTIGGVHYKVPEIVSFTPAIRPVDQLEKFIEMNLLRELQVDSKVILDREETQFLAHKGVDLKAHTIKI